MASYTVSSELLIAEPYSFWTKIDELTDKFGFDLLFLKEMLAYLEWVSNPCDFTKPKYDFIMKHMDRFKGNSKEMESVFYPLHAAIQVSDDWENYKLNCRLPNPQAQNILHIAAHYSSSRFVKCVKMLKDKVVHEMFLELDIYNKNPFEIFIANNVKFLDFKSKPVSELVKFLKQNKTSQIFSS